MITVSSSTAMTDMADIIQYIKAYTSEYVLSFLDTQDQLNNQLEDVLKYGLYDDKKFSELSAYRKKLLFNTNIEQTDKVTIQLPEQKLLEI